MTNQKYKINETLQNQLYEIINDYNGGEIFFGCIFDENFQLSNFEPVCYGNENAVLAPYEISKNYNAILHNHPSGNIMPSENDLKIAGMLQNEGIGFFIINNDATKLNTVVPPIFTKDKIKIKNEDIISIFSKNGILNKLKSDYEFREGQLSMSLKIVEAINENKITVIEAGTGIGKSMAYLIPAFLWVINNKERIVIATNTINLQNQLYNKDIPFVQKLLNSDVKTIIVKGRRNYLCKLKVSNIQNELEFNEQSEEFNSILKWASITDTGEIDDLNFIPDNSLWERASSDVDFCINRHCMFFQNCFFQITRRKASESQILIVNHHILFADIQYRTSNENTEENFILPNYKKIIIDEAHNIEKNSSSFFSLTFSKGAFLKFLSILKKKNNAGFLNYLLKKLNHSNSKEAKQFSNILDNEILPKFNHMQISSIQIFSKINDFINDKINSSDNTNNNKFNFAYRIKNNEWESQDFIDNFINCFSELTQIVNEFLKSLEDFQTQLEQSKLIKKFEIEFKLLKSYFNKLNSICENTNKLLNIDINEFVPWIEASGDNDDLFFKFNATPLFLNKILSDCLFNYFESIVLCSATLTVNKTFNFFNYHTGLNLVKDKDISFDIIDSPFDYQNHVLFVAPTDIPDPREFNYSDKLNDYLIKTIPASNGSAFVLFTSYRQLKISFDIAGEELINNGYHCYYQGEIEKFKLLEKFINEVKSSLFATNSFWEGVDAPGKTLKHVILAKLPFQMPTDPIEEAKVELLTKKGLNPFMDYTLPSAIIKFRQGFGRLIRTKNDYGVVAILDSRILNKQYGKMFFHSLPRCKFFQGDTSQIVSQIKNHLEKFE